MGASKSCDQKLRWQASDLFAHIWFRVDYSASHCIWHHATLCVPKLFLFLLLTKMEVLRTYYWFCAQKSLLLEFGETWWMQNIEPMSGACNTTHDHRTMIAYFQRLGHWSLSLSPKGNILWNWSREGIQTPGLTPPSDPFSFCACYVLPGHI